MYIKFKDGKSKALTLSYDDGNVQDIRLAKLFSKYGIKATFNINSGLFLKEDNSVDTKFRRLKLSEAKALYQQSGHEVASHTVSHIRPDTVEESELMYEIMEDRKVLEQEFDIFVRGFAHPYSVCNETIKEILSQCGYSYARGGESSYNFKLPEDRFLIKPTCSHKDPKFIEFADKFINDEPKWGDVWIFYVMGHSFEFDIDDNWEIIEKFCETVSGKDDVWYATNIEIFDYIDAYRALKTTVDKKIIYNPSVIDVWVEHKGKIYKIPADESVVTE